MQWSTVRDSAKYSTRRIGECRHGACSLANLASVKVWNVLNTDLNTFGQNDISMSVCRCGVYYLSVCQCVPFCHLIPLPPRHVSSMSLPFSVVSKTCLPHLPFMGTEDDLKVISGSLREHRKRLHRGWTDVLQSHLQCLLYRKKRQFWIKI
jgi:hypothetical protein